MQGKGAKDRYTLLADKLLDKLRQYFVAAKRPKQFLFTSTQTGKAFHPRSMQLVVTGAMKKAGFTRPVQTSNATFCNTVVDNKLMTAFCQFLRKNQCGKGLAKSRNGKINDNPLIFKD